MTNIAFARQSAGAADHLEHSGERLLNCYARSFPDNGVGPFIVAMSPGLTAVATLTDGSPVRAMYAQRGIVYAVCGGQFWTWDGTTATARGAVPDTAASVITGNGLEVAAAIGGDYYLWNGSALTTPASGAFSAVGSVAAIDGYVLLGEQNGERWSVSGLQNAGVVDALDFASAEGAPDYIVRVHVDHSEVWLFGTRSTEIWANAGGADFPFVRLSGGKLDRGCLWPWSVASEDNSVFWVGNDRVVYRANGYQPQRISTQWVESVLMDVAQSVDVRAFTFTQDGAKVYALILPDRPALLFDIASGLWHERNTGLAGGRWIANAACACDAATYVGTTDGKICTFGGVTDAGAIIMREGVSMPLAVKRQPVTLSMVQLHFRTGTASLTADANVMLQHSADGRTWGLERWRPLGRTGQFDRLVRWWGFGQARQHRVRFRITDPIEGALYGATYEAAR